MGPIDSIVVIKSKMSDAKYPKLLLLSLITDRNLPKFVNNIVK